VTIDEWREGAASGEIVEAFACGTAAVITPIAEIKAADFTISMPEVDDRVSMSLRQELTDIQYGRVPDRHGWLRRLDA
jgi:branched-chain amino acid aminotransferase